jgi:hypothetical protein
MESKILLQSPLNPINYKNSFAIRLDYHFQMVNEEKDVYFYHFMMPL